MYSEDKDSELFAVAPDNLSTAKTVAQLLFVIIRTIQKVISIYFPEPT
jgi:hypothetical protein